jgi:hypothetical protein
MRTAESLCCVLSVTAENAAGDVAFRIDRHQVAVDQTRLRKKYPRVDSNH